MSIPVSADVAGRVSLPLSALDFGLIGMAVAEMSITGEFGGERLTPGQVDRLNELEARLREVSHQIFPPEVVRHG